MTDNATIAVNLLDKDYQVACPPEEQAILQSAARQLDQRLRDIRSTGNVIGLEKIAIMAALNLSYELMLAKESSASADLDSDKLKSLVDTLDAALSK
ncbi:cell division protein ZapA [Aurantivibrio plasticivorans]